MMNLSCLHVYFQRGMFYRTEGEGLEARVQEGSEFHVHFMLSVDGEYSFKIGLLRKK